MSWNKRDYPANWPALRAAVLARAGNCCEGSPQYSDCRAAQGEPHPVTGSRVVLTTAHRHGTAKQTQRLEDLICLCQRCHLSYDRVLHAARARRTRARKRGQPLLPGMSNV